jgi:galactokinase
MPKHLKDPQQPVASSTFRRRRLAEFIETFGNVMVKKCSTCAKHNRVCKVHVSSGKCSACHFRNQRCDVRVTQSEFTRLAAEKEKLRKQIKESRDAQDAALKAHERALEELRVARSREERLRQQMDLIDRRADEAIAVESREIEELDQAESSEVLTFGEVPEDGFNLHLSPSTWGAFEGYPLDFWDPSVDIAQATVDSS